MGKKKVDMLKARTPEWDADLYQGKRKDQVEFSYMVVGVCIVIAFIAAGILFYVKSMN
jgi:hypothetical protein